MKLLLVLFALTLNIAKIEAEEDCPKLIHVWGNDDTQGAYKLYGDTFYGNYTLSRYIDGKPLYYKGIASDKDYGDWIIRWDSDFSVLGLVFPGWVIINPWTEETLAYNTDDDDCPYLFTSKWKYFVPSINRWFDAGDNLQIVTIGWLELLVDYDD